MSMNNARQLLKLVEKDRQLAAQLAGTTDRDLLAQQLVEAAETRGMAVTLDEVRRVLDEATPPYDVLLMNSDS